MTDSIKEWFEKQSLAFKLSLSIFVCLFIVFGCLLFILVNRSESIVARQTQDIGGKSVQSYVSDIEHLAFDTEQIILNTKYLLNQMPANDVSSFRIVLNSAVKTVYLSALTFTDAWVYVFSPEDVSVGTLYRAADVDGNISFKEENVQNLYQLLPWFKSVPKVEEIYWSEPYVHKVYNKTVVTCLVPFMFHGSTDFDGLVALTVDLSQMTESIAKFSFAETGKLLLISRRGLYISHPDSRIQLKMTIFELANKINEPKLADAGRRALAGRTGTTTIPYSSVFKGPAVFFYAPIEPLKWGLFLVYSEKELIRPILSIKYLMAVPLLLGMLILVFFIYRICHNSTRQLLKLSVIAAKYGKGDFSKSMEDIQSSDEIGVLAGAMSDMRLNLLNYIEKEKNEVKTKQKAESELLIAQNIQKSALSTAYPNHDAFKMSTQMVSARQVGGDFYDFFFINKTHFAIVVADVSGKGIPAALYMMKAQTLIKNISKEKQNLQQAFYQINNDLYEGNENCMFVSAFMAVIDIISGHVEYINAGHTHPLVDKGSGYHFIRPEKNTVLGVRKNFNFTSQTFTLKKGNRIFLYTDGVTEAQNEKKAFFGEERLVKTLSKKFVSPDKTLQDVLHRIQKFAGDAPQSDDITMLEFYFNGINGLSLCVPAKNESLPKVIALLKEDMNSKNVCQAAQFKIIMAAEEIFANIADYAYPNNPNGKTDLLTSMDNNTYMVAFIDAGQRYNPLERKDPDVSLDLRSRKIGGLGIFIAKKMADEIEYFYDNSHNILRIKVINKEA